MRQNLWITVVTLITIIVLEQPVQAQNNNASAVQLPTFSYFTAPTTVSVPDRGGTYMGGINRSASGITESGSPLLPFRNRSIGNESSASSISTHVYIHDFEAMDQAILDSVSPGNNSATPVIKNGNRTIPFRYVPTQPQAKKTTGMTTKQGNQVPVRKRPKSNKTSDIDAPLVLSGPQNQAVSNNKNERLRDK